MRTNTRRGYRQIIEGDLELMPLMNLFVAMIPMLLISAVFLNVTVIDMKAPSDQAQVNPSQKENLLLAVTIKKDYFVIEGHGITKQVVARSDADANDKLAAALASISSQHPDNQDIIVISEPRTHYGEIVAVMDIARANGAPSVALMGAE
jgi:biopolymer transport protein ExbD